MAVPCRVYNLTQWTVFVLIFIWKLMWELLNFPQEVTITCEPSETLRRFEKPPIISVIDLQTPQNLRYKLMATQPVPAFYATSRSVRYFVHETPTIFHCCEPDEFIQHPPILYYVFFWVFPRRLNYICRRFGTLYLFHLHRQVVWSSLHTTYDKCT
jgi:hypothetical protein